MPSIPVNEVPDARVGGLGAPAKRAAQSNGLEMASKAFGEVAKLGESLGKLQAREKNKADATKVMGAEAQWDEFRSSLDLEFGSLKGENAAQMSGEYHKRLAEKRQEIFGGLSNDDQRRAFNMRSRQGLGASKLSIERHVAQEGALALKASEIAFDEEKTKLVRQNYADDQAFAATLSAAAPVYQGRAALQGLPDDAANGDAAKVYVDQKIAQLHEARLVAAIDAKDGAKAKAIFDQSKGALGELAGKYAQDVERLGRDGRVESRFAELWQGAARQDSPWHRMEVADDAVESLPNDDPDKGALRNMLDHQIAREDAQRDRLAREKLQQAMALVKSGARRSDERLGAIDRWFSDPANGHIDTWDRYWSAKDAEARARASRARGDRGGEAAARRELELRGKEALERLKEVRGGNIADAVAMDPETDFGEITPLYKQKIRALQANYKRVIDGGGEAKLDDFRAKAKTVFKGLKRKKVDEADFVEEAERRYTELMGTGGDIPTNADADAVLGKMSTLGELDRFGPFDEDVYEFELTDEKRAKWSAYPPEKQRSPSARAAAARGNQQAPAAPAAPAAPVTQLEPADEAPPLVDLARANKKAAFDRIRAEHPTWSPAQVSAELARNVKR